MDWTRTGVSTQLLPVDSFTHKQNILLITVKKNLVWLSQTSTAQWQYFLAHVKYIGNNLLFMLLIVLIED